jgi:cytochrome c551/c552
MPLIHRIVLGVVLGASAVAFGQQSMTAEQFIRRFQDGSVGHARELLKMPKSEQDLVRKHLIDTFAQPGAGQRRLDVLRVLGDVRDPAVIALAIQALQSNDSALQRHGAGACWQLAAKTCLPLLRELLAKTERDASDPSGAVLRRIVRDIEAGKPYRDVDDR